MKETEHDCEKIGCHLVALNVGIDWADQEHVFEMRVVESTQRKTGTVFQTPEALAEWILQLKQTIPAGAKIAVALEQSRGALIHFLQQFSFLVIYPINPKSLAKFREAFRPSCSKDDPDDAGCLLDMLERHHRRLRAWQPDDPDTRKLALFCELRRKAVDQRTGLVNTVTAYLKLYFPQAVDWAGDLTSTMACHFLQKWPTFEAIHRTSSNSIRNFYQKHHCRRSELIEHRLTEIRQATALTPDPAIIEPYAVIVAAYAGVILQLNETIGKYDKQIDGLFSQHPDHALFAALPGAGQIMAPRLLAAIGTDRNRYESAIHVQQYSGIAPITKRSGAQMCVVRRIGKPDFVHQTWLEFAQHSVGFCAWAEAFYRHQRSLRKGRYAALRALAYKWIRIIFHCWKYNQPYDEEKYLQALARRNSSLVSLINHA